MSFNWPEAAFFIPQIRAGFEVLFLEPGVSSPGGFLARPDEQIILFHFIRSDGRRTLVLNIFEQLWSAMHYQNNILQSFILLSVYSLEAVVGVFTNK